MSGTVTGIHDETSRSPPVLPVRVRDRMWAAVVDRRRGGCVGVLESDEEIFGEERTGLSYPAYVRE